MLLAQSTFQSIVFISKCSKVHILDDYKAMISWFLAQCSFLEDLKKNYTKGMKFF